MTADDGRSSAAGQVDDPGHDDTVEVDPANDIVDPEIAATHVTIDLTGRVPTRTVESAAVRSTKTTSAPRAGATPVAPAAMTSAPPPDMLRPRRRRVPVLISLLLVAAAVASAVAFANYTTAVSWKARAEAADRRAATASAEAVVSRRAADEARRARQVAQRRRRQMARQLAVSEADVSTLEARVAALANERAQAQDIGAVVPAIDRGALSRTLRAQVDSCVSQVDAARAGLAGATDPAAWRPAVTAALASCQQAAADLDALVDSAP